MGTKLLVIFRHIILFSIIFLSGFSIVPTSCFAEEEDPGFDQPPPPSLAPDAKTSTEMEPPISPKIPKSAKSNDGYIPIFERVKPQWALELAYSQNTFTNSATISKSSVSIQSGSIVFEYQPRFLQTFGVLGVGVMTAVYSVSPSGILTNSPLDFYSVGTQVRYQAQFIKGQFLVPYVGYGMEYILYKFIGSQQQSKTENGALLGLMFLINSIDKKSAYEFYRNSGISRTYLLAEMRGSSSGNQSPAFNPVTWYFGIRVEL